jgi:hypothetical protein
MTNIKYKSRGDCHVIRLDSSKNSRQDFKLTNQQQSAEKISGGNSWTNSYLIGTKEFKNKGVYFFEIVLNKIHSDKSGKYKIDKY